MATHKAAGIPIAPGLDNAMDLPHTISYAILYRERLDSFNELPKDKRPPRNLWDKPNKLNEYFDKMWNSKKEDNRGSKSLDFDMEDVE